MDKHAYLAALRENERALAAAARRNLQAPVPSCPAWNVGALVGHVIAVYRGWDRIVRARGAEPSRDPADYAAAFAAYAGFHDWYTRDMPHDEVPARAVDWLDDACASLADALAAADPADHVWTWFPPDQTAGFVQRRMAQETAVHRWDAQAAVGTPEPIDAELARDGIDEMLDVHLPVRPQWAPGRPGLGERYHLHRTDGEGEWLVEFRPEGVRVSREHARGDIALRGTASDLLLWLWGRIPADRLEIHGDETLIGRWFELVPAG